MTKLELKEILEKHKLWNHNQGGKRAYLRYADLSSANLSGANLSYADLSGADLSSADLSSADLRDAYLGCADLSGANLSGADLSTADLSGALLRGVCLDNADLRGANLDDADLDNADLCGASLSGASLSGADLSSANLRGANLSGADLRDVKYNEATSFFALQCPEEGAFVAWKKCRDDVIVKLLIPEDAKRSSATSRKCRASKAVVLDVIGAEKGISSTDKTFVYEVGKEVVPDFFDEDRWNECSHGIHFFITRAEAERYQL